MKVILGPLPCHTCGTPVTIVRRTVEQPCDGECYWNDQGFECPTGEHAHTHTLPDVGPFAAVDDDGTRHECESNR